MFPVVSQLDAHLVLRAQSGAHVKLRRRKYIFIYTYLFIYLFIFCLKLTCTQLYNKSQLTSTIKSRLDICTCYINIEL